MSSLKRLQGITDIEENVDLGPDFFSLLDQFWSTAAMFLHSNILMTYQIKANNM